MFLSEEQRRYLENASAEELQEIIKVANTVIDKRADNRRKELWGNVAAAIRKYEQEVDEIIIEGSSDGEGCLCTDNLDLPGIIYVAY